MAGEKNEREVVRVENAQYTDGAGGDTQWGLERCALITRNTTTGRVLHTGDTGGERVRCIFIWHCGWVGVSLHPILETCITENCNDEKITTDCLVRYPAGNQCHGTRKQHPYGW